MINRSFISNKNVFSREPTLTTVPTFYAELTSDRYSQFAATGNIVHNMTKSTDFGDTLVSIVSWSSPVVNISSIVDTKLNTWNIQTRSGSYFGGSSIIISWAYITNPIQISDTITINWSNSGTSFNRAGAFFVLKGCNPSGQPVKEVQNYYESPGASVIGSGIAPISTLCLGVIVGSGGNGIKYSGCNWNIIGNPQATPTNNFYIYKQIYQTAGLIDPQGAIMNSLNTAPYGGASFANWMAFQ